MPFMSPSACFTAWPSAMPTSSVVWWWSMCRSPLALTVMSMREWRASRSSMWSRKPMPVATCERPGPSRSTRPRRRSPWSCASPPLCAWNMALQVARLLSGVAGIRHRAPAAFDSVDFIRAAGRMVPVSPVWRISPWQPTNPLFRIGKSSPARTARSGSCSRAFSRWWRCCRPSTAAPFALVGAWRSPLPLPPSLSSRPACLHPFNRVWFALGHLLAPRGQSGGHGGDVLRRDPADGVAPARARQRSAAAQARRRQRPPIGLCASRRRPAPGSMGKQF